MSTDPTAKTNNVPGTYLWKQVDVYTGIYCRSKTCSKAHYRDGEPKSLMVLLEVVPHRRYTNEILFCNRCKGIKYTF